MALRASGHLSCAISLSTCAPLLLARAIWSGYPLPFPELQLESAHLDLVAVRERRALHLQSIYPYSVPPKVLDPDAAFGSVDPRLLPGDGCARRADIAVPAADEDRRVLDGTAGVETSLAKLQMGLGPKALHREKVLELDRV